MSYSDMVYLISRLDRIDARLDQIYGLEGRIMDAITALENQVAQTLTVEQSALVLVQGIPALIAAAGVDPKRLAKLQADLAASAASLAAAVVANTPVAPPPAS